MQAAWANVAPRTALAPPTPEAKRQLACRAVDVASGDVQEQGRPAASRGISECFRIGRDGRIVDTQYQLVSRESADESRGYYYVSPNPNPFGFFFGGNEQRGGYYYYDNNGRYVPSQRDPYRQPGQPPQQYYYGQQPYYYGQQQQPPQRQPNPRVQAPQ